MSSAKKSPNQSSSRCGRDDFSDAALVIIGHGSTTNSESAQPVYQHAEELRRRGVFSEVREAFWKQEPRILEVANSVSANRVFFVPLMISEGYFSEETIPLELKFRNTDEKGFSRIQRRESHTWYYGAPIGTHESMTDIILTRARGVLEQNPFPIKAQLEQTALFVAGHGTGRNEHSRKAIESQVTAIRTRAMFAEVHAVFMEEEPRIGDCFKISGSRNLVIVPFFISDGQHTNEDIPVMLGESQKAVRRRMEQSRTTWRNPTERKGKMVWYTASVGSEPKIADVIMERVREVAALGF